jgi:SAM-dependent methyltransferase
VNLKKNLKQNKYIRSIYFLFQGIRDFFRFKPLSLIKQYVWFLGQFKTFKQVGNNDEFKKIEYYPCLLDNIKYTPLDPTYFYQDTWAAQKIFSLKPKHHYDIGSSAKTIGILSQFVPITMVDIRPLPLKLNGLNFIEGSILDLPFESNSIESISSLCVVEHIGLGRYGDELDQFGSEKAITELKRVVCRGGVVLFSIPVDNENKIYFNAHRAFTREYIIKLFDEFELIEEKYQYGNALYEEYSLNKGFGTGLFMFEKRRN